MKSKNVIFIFLIVLGIVTTLFATRGYYFERFDPSYWKERYDQSPWSLPLSTRPIGDDGLYLYQGYALIRGADPTILNPEVPPLGKYLIGLTAITTKNPSLYGFGIGIGVIISFFFLSKKVLQNTSYALFATSLLALDPLFMNQLHLTMLDSLQLLFFILVFLLIAYTPWVNKRKSLYFISSIGLLLGLCAEVKIPLLIPFLFIILIFLFFKMKRVFLIAPLFIAFCIGYLIPYIPYFLQGHSLLEWARIQKYIAHFYIESELSANYFSAALSLLTGYSQNLFTGKFEKALEWTPSWLLFSLSVPYFLLRLKKKAQNPNGGVLLFWVFVTLLFLCFLPFWTRYLLVLLPFLIILYAAFIQNIKFQKVKVILGFFPLLFSFVFLIKLLFPTPEEAVKDLVYNIEHGFFTDIHRAMPESLRSHSKWQDFNKTGLVAYHNSEIEQVMVDINPTKWKRFQKNQNLIISTTYTTRNLGSFSHTSTIPIISDHGQWKIVWDWKYLFNNMTKNSTFQTTVDKGKRGRILDENGQVLAEDAPSFLISVIPKDLDRTRESELYSLLEYAFPIKMGSVFLHQRLVFNTLPALPRTLGVLKYDVHPETLKKIQSISGVIITPARVRAQYKTAAQKNIGEMENITYKECCSYNYSTSSYSGTSGLEEEFETTIRAQNGGKLLMTTNNKRGIELIQKSKKNGEDVIVR